MPSPPLPIPDSPLERIALALRLGRRARFLYAHRPVDTGAVARGPTHIAGDVTYPRVATVEALNAGASVDQTGHDASSDT